MTSSLRCIVSATHAWARAIPVVVMLFVVGVGEGSHSYAGATDGQRAPQRIVSIGGSLTEILFELGVADRIVGVDQTSMWPPDVEGLPKVGYMRALSIEGVVSLRPDVVVSFRDVEPRTALEQLRSFGIDVWEFDRDPSVAQVNQNIRVLARRIGMEAQGEALVRRIEDELARAREVAERGPRAPRVLFLLNMGQGPMLVSGRGSAADLVLRLAGAENLADFDGYKPFSPEVLVAAKPDVLVTTTDGFESMGGWEGIARLPGVAGTDAFRRRAFVVVDANRILGVGPRLGTSVRELAEALRSAAGMEE